MIGHTGVTGSIGITTRKGCRIIFRDVKGSRPCDRHPPQSPSAKPIGGCLAPWLAPWGRFAPPMQTRAPPAASSSRWSEAAEIRREPGGELVLLYGIVLIIFCRLGYYPTPGCKGQPDPPTNEDDKLEKQIKRDWPEGQYINARW